MFEVREGLIEADNLRERLRRLSTGAALVYLEEWACEQEMGKWVDYLVYSTYEVLAETRGNALIDNIKCQFNIDAILCVHRVGQVDVGEMVMCLGVCAKQAEVAWAAGQALLTAMRVEVPIRKAVFYRD